MAKLSVEVQIEVPDNMPMRFIGGALQEAVNSLQRDLNCEARVVACPATGRLPALLRRQAI